jgi:1-acyl-sn-glycerol-3-phosphate acyltransferase
VHHRLICVAKHAMFVSPLVGRLLKACWHIDAGQGDIFSGVAVIRASQERLSQGLPVLIFPEGTRSPERGLGRFRQGAFDLAVRAGVPVLPVFITMDPPTLMRGVPWYVIPPRTATLRVRPLPLVETAGRDPAQLCKQMEEDFRRLVDEFYADKPLPAQAALRPTG